MKTAQDCNRWREAIRLRGGGALEAEAAALVETHLVACAECRRYAEEVQATAAGLRWLSSREIEPSAGFRTRWTQAVETAARPSDLGETAAALAAWWRGLLLRNLRPALGVASLWILALLFRLSAPDVSPSTHSTAARSPVEIYRALGGHEQLLAGHLGRQFPAPNTPQKSHLGQPRSEGLPAQPAARWEHGPGMDAAVCELFPNPITHGNPSKLLPV